MFSHSINVTITADLKFELLLFSDCPVLAAIQSYRLFMTEILLPLQKLIQKNRLYKILQWYFNRHIFVCHSLQRGLVQLAKRPMIKMLWMPAFFS